MSAEVAAIEVLDRDVRRALIRTPRFMAEEIRGELKWWGMEHRKLAARNFAAQISGEGDRFGAKNRAAFFWMRGQSKNRNKAQLRQYRKGKTLDDLELGIFAPTDKAKAHEFGETVRAKGGQWMAIPVAQSLSPGGRLKKQFRDVRGNFDTARLPNGVRMLKIRGKFYLGTVKTEADGYDDVSAIYARLMPEVRIPRRPYFHAPWSQFAPKRREGLRKAAERALRKSTRRAA